MAKKIFNKETRYILADMVKAQGMEFREIPCSPGIKVSRCGLVLNNESSTSFIMSSRVMNEGYERIQYTVNGKLIYRNVHRLVALAWVENDDPDNKLFVNHIDGNKLNNNADNLEWVTHRENIIHAVKTGLRVSKGKKNTSKEKIKAIRETDISTTSYRKLAKKYNINKTTAKKIYNWETFKNV